MAIDPHKLKPVELVRLLNSTPLGTTVSRDRVYRQQDQGGLRIGDGETVDIVRYASWLFTGWWERRPARRELTREEKHLIDEATRNRLPESLPLLANHENRTASRVGVISARVVNGTLEIEGEIVASGGVTEEIVAQAKAGADWQLSIGAEVKASELVRAGETREVNGHHHDGPFFHIRRAALREVSVVAVGADGATRLKIAAHFNLGSVAE